MNTATKLQTTATIHHLPVVGEKQLSIEGFMELPDQPIPDDCDLRNFRYMPFDVQRFIDSKFATTVDPASGFFAIQLWAKAWHQLPAGSLPNDDDQLRSLSGCGRDTRLWQSVREGALYGWVLHSDGRLYHKALTEFVLEAYDKLLINREKGKKGGRPRKDNGNADAIHQDNTEKATENPRLYNGKAAVNQEKGREENRREDITPHSPPKTIDEIPPATPSDVSAKPSPAKPRKKTKIPMPDDFGVSEQVQVWADSKGYSRLPERLEHFRNWATAKGAEYVGSAGWDAAFRNAISGDWAKLNGRPNAGISRTSPMPLRGNDSAREKARQMLFGNSAQAGGKVIDGELAK